MDGQWLIEENRQALKRIVLALVGLVHGATLPRRVRNGIFRLLRPAEAATRRLVIAMARGLFVPAPPSLHWRERPLRGALRNGVVNGFGTGILWPAGAKPPAALPARLALALLDPLPRAHPKRSKSIPSISVPGATGRIAMPPPTSPCDEISAARLVLRFNALSAALDDLSTQAQRFARWQARRRAAQAMGKHPRWPLRMRLPRVRRSKHEVFAVLTSAHQLAYFALENPDTS